MSRSNITAEQPRTKDERSSKAPIYRDLELFLDWVGVVVDRAPKLPSVQVLCEEVIRDVSDALSVTSLALQQNKGPQRLELIKVLSVRLQHIDSIVGYFYVISSKRKMPDGEVINPRARVLTPKQKIAYTEKMNNLRSQLEDWLNANSF